jgi:hypothetical protein
MVKEKLYYDAHGKDTYEAFVYSDGQRVFIFRFPQSEGKILNYAKRYGYKPVRILANP